MNDPDRYVVDSESQRPVYVYGGPPTSGLAIASMVLGIIWLYWVGSILAVIFGAVAIKQCNRGERTGKGMAVAGLVLGLVGVGILALAIVVAAFGGFAETS